MGTTYLVRKKPDGGIWSLIRYCDSGAIEHLVNGKWLPAPKAFYIFTGEIGDEITKEEARTIAPQFGGTIELDAEEC